ncbi:hypothetical protein C2W58_01936 [Bacillus pumilus]|nr:hypothetical protein C2W58_01936 [Bacillus pumilus]
MSVLLISAIAVSTVQLNKGTDGALEAEQPYKTADIRPGG